MRRVLIIGATSAIAQQVARLYADAGDRLHLVGRNADKLQALVAQLPADRTTSARADLDDLNDNARVVADAVTGLGGLDVAFLAHGYLGDQLASERAFDEASRIFTTNLLSAVSLLVPIANQMEGARGGRIGVITSVAGDRGRPRNYTYGSAKGALNIYLQGMRSRLVPAGVTVTTLKCGPVDSPMTVDHPKTRLFAQPATVARAMVAAVDAGTAEAYVPWFWAAIMGVVRNAPESLFQRARFLSGR